MLYVVTVEGPIYVRLSNASLGVQLPIWQILVQTVNEKMQLYFQSASMMMLNYFCFAVNKGCTLGGIEYPFVHIFKCLLCGDRTNKCNEYSVCPML